MYQKLIRALLLSLIFTVLCSAGAHAQSAGRWSTLYEPHIADYNQVEQDRQVAYYRFRNNVWGDDVYPLHDGLNWQYMWASWEQNINGIAWGVDAEHTNGVDSLPDRREGGVKSYPSIVRGWAIGVGYVSDNHELGIKVDQLDRARVGWNFKSPNSGRQQALIDIYLHWWHSPGTSLPALNIQLVPHWHDSTGYIDNPNNIGRGPNDSDSAYTIGRRWIGDIQYQGWVKWEHPDREIGAGERFFHVRPVQFRNGASNKNAIHDVKGIIDWARSDAANGIAHENMYLTGVQAGFELIDGGRGFVTQSYWTDIR